MSSSPRWPTAAERSRRGGVTVLVLIGAGTAERAAERLRAADLGVTLATDGLVDPPKPGVVTVTRGRLDAGFVLVASDLAVLTESDLLGTRGASAIGVRQAAVPPTKRRRSAGAEAR